MASRKGFETLTYGLGNRCSILLSYRDLRRRAAVRLAWSGLRRHWARRAGDPFAGAERCPGWGVRMPGGAALTIDLRDRAAAGTRYYVHYLERSDGEPHYSRAT